MFGLPKKQEKQAGSWIGIFLDGILGAAKVFCVQGAPRASNWCWTKSGPNPPLGWSYWFDLDHIGLESFDVTHHFRMVHSSIKNSSRVNLTHRATQLAFRLSNFWRMASSFLEPLFWSSTNDIQKTESISSAEEV